TDSLAFGGGGGLLPIFIAEFVIPRNRGATLRYTLFQPNRVDDLRARLTPFVPRRGEGMIFAGVNGILQSEFNGVEAHCPRDLFQVTVEGPIALWHAIS